jgi:hypothetical protein
MALRPSLFPPCRQPGSSGEPQDEILRLFVLVGVKHGAKKQPQAFGVCLLSCIYKCSVRDDYAHQVGADAADVVRWDCTWKHRFPIPIIVEFRWYKKGTGQALQLKSEHANAMFQGVDIPCPHQPDQQAPFVQAVAQIRLSLLCGPSNHLDDFFGKSHLHFWTTIAACTEAGLLGRLAKEQTMIALNPKAAAPEGPKPLHRPEHLLPVEQVLACIKVSARLKSRGDFKDIVIDLLQATLSPQQFQAAKADVESGRVRLPDEIALQSFRIKLDMYAMLFDRHLLERGEFESSFINLGADSSPQCHLVYY